MPSVTDTENAFLTPTGLYSSSTPNKRESIRLRLVLGALLYRQPVLC